MIEILHASPTGSTLGCASTGWARPYTVILAIGLVYGIAASVRALIHDAETRLDVFKVVVAVLFQLALLINQLAQFHEYRRAREARKAERSLNRRT